MGMGEQVSEADKKGVLCSFDMQCAKAFVKVTVLKTLITSRTTTKTTIFDTIIFYQRISHHQLDKIHESSKIEHPSTVYMYCRVYVLQTEKAFIA